jgi:hypothetical protein
MLITLGSILPSLTAKFMMNEISSGKLVSLLPIGIIAAHWYLVLLPTGMVIKCYS